MNKNNTQRNTLLKDGQVKAAIRYATLPGIFPRIRALGVHFGHFAYLIALVLNSARLIPLQHSVLSPRSIGQYGVRDVLAIAANNLRWSWKNTDQVAIFIAIVTGIVLTVVQVALIAVFALTGTAQAAPASSFFATPNADTDLAHIFLSQVFGTELDMFGSGGGVIGTTGNPIHSVILQMLQLYSMATMVIAVIIVLYYVLTVVGEATQHGMPFGKRFNTLWAPIRLVVALGLLVPLGSGLNSAQYITLWMAKMGSGLGTQTWLVMADVMKTSDPTKYNVTLSERLMLHNMIKNAFVAATCAQAHTDHARGGASWDRVLLRGSTDNSFVYEWRGPDSAPHHRRSCGSVGVSFPDGQENVGLGTNIFGIKERESAIPTDKLLVAVRPVIEQALTEVETVASGYTGGLNDAVIAEQLTEIAEYFSEELTRKVSDVYTNEVDADLRELMRDMDEKGWLYAGVWYIQINRTMQSAYQQRSKAVPGVIIPSRYTNPEAPGFWDTLTGSWSEADQRVNAAITLVDTYSLTPSLPSRAATAVSDSYDKSCLAATTEGGADLSIMEKLQCVIASTFVPEQLTALSRDPTYDPMGVLVAAGGTILSRAYELAVWGFGAKAVGGALSAIPFVGGIGGLAGEIGGMLITIAFVGFGAGIILYFLLPIFPFMYFFFAVVGWVMEIFEAIVAMPLWALAHLRIEGDGMPGPAAINGYYLLLAILLRPALIIFGLIASSLIFFAAIFALQILFTPLIEVTREDGLFGLEIMLFTVIFAYMAYMIGLSCFKLVDTIPNQILRWIGSSAGTFNDQREDSIHGAQSAFLGGAVLGQQFAGGIGGIGAGVGQGAGGMFKSFRDAKNQKAGDAESLRRHNELVGAKQGDGGQGSGEHQGTTSQGGSYSYGNNIPDGIGTSKPLDGKIGGTASGSYGTNRTSDDDEDTKK